MRPARRSVIEAVGVERAEVAACRDVTGPQLEVEAGGRQRAPPELERLRVVAEQPEVAGPRARRDPGADRLAQSRDALGGEPVEVRA